MFEVRIKEKESQEIEKHYFAASKVKITTRTALNTDAIWMAILNNVDIVFTETTGTRWGASATANWVAL
jgi:CRISPR/Cas system-associated endonuclease Cas1